MTTTRRSDWTRTLAAALFGAICAVLSACTASPDVALDPSASPTATPGPTPTATPPPGSGATEPGDSSTDSDAAPAATMSPAPQSSSPQDQSAHSSGPAGSAPISNPAQYATLDETACRFEQPSSARADCFDLRVPENWHAPTNGSTVTLHVALFSARAASSQPDPIVYLEGGPGGHALSRISFSFGELFSHLVAERDVIVFDQRGAGLSEPELACPGVNQAGLEEITTRAEGGGPEDERAALLLAIEACRDDLLAQNVGLSHYNSVSSAADLEAMRTLLEYDQWNLYSISYGTRLAQTTMRLYPDGIRSAVLDSILPANADMAAVFAPNGRRAFEQLFNGCESNTGCNDTYANLEQRFFALVDEWNNEPVTFAGINPLTAMDIEFVVDGEDLKDVAYSALYNQGSFSALPEIVAQAEERRYSVLAGLLAQYVATQDLISVGMFVSVGCTEEEPFADADAVAAFAPDDPRYATFVDELNAAPFQDICDIWDVSPVAPVENELVDSDIPSLLMAGSYDPITPPAGITQVQSGLSNATAVVFPHEGHGVSLSACGKTLTQNFFAEPTAELDVRCVASSPAPFWVSDGEQPITMEPYRSEDTGLTVTGLRPAEWDDGGGGVFSRSNNNADPALLLTQGTFDISAADVVQLLGDVFAWPTLPDFEESRTVDGTDWSVFRGDYPDSSAIVAISSAGAESMVILVQGKPEDFPRFDTDIFEPVLAAAEAG